MSAPAAVIPRTEHPDYISARAAVEVARDAAHEARARHQVESAVVAVQAVRGLLPTEQGRQDWLATKAAEEAAALAYRAALDALQVVRVRLGLAR